MGAQGNLWSEYLYNWDKVEYMVLPRMIALSEVLWSPKPQQALKENPAEFTGSFDDFRRRLRPHSAWMNRDGLHFSPHGWEPMHQALPVLDPKE
jgi:hexosaminidase